MNLFLKSAGVDFSWFPECRKYEIVNLTLRLAKFGVGILLTLFGLSPELANGANVFTRASSRHPGRYWRPQAPFSLHRPTNGSPTVIFESGGGGSSKDWSRVRDLLSSRVRMCAYDRAGLGWSEVGPAPRTMKQEVFELHALLSPKSQSRRRAHGQMAIFWFPSFDFPDNEHSF